MTAVTQVHRQVSELRRVLGRDAIETRPPGYRLPVAPGAARPRALRAADRRGGADLARGDAARGAGLLREALALWRGEPLADLAFEPFAAPAVARLQELRLAAIEARIEADLALGAPRGWWPSWTALVAEHPLRERLHAQRILALYRAGRQREALDGLRELRRALVDAFGIEPTPPLQELERRILRHDPGCTRAAASPPPGRRDDPRRGTGADALDALLQIAEPLAATPVRELVVVQLVPTTPARVPTPRRRRSPAAPGRRRRGRPRSRPPTRRPTSLRLEPPTRPTSCCWRRTGRWTGRACPGRWCAAARARRPTSAILAARGGPGGTGIAVPFAGGDHDWAAVETAAWFAQATGQELRLAGALGDDRGGRRDASRLLADASLAIQRLVGIDAVPQLVEPGSRRCWPSWRAPRWSSPACRRGGARTVSGRAPRAGRAPHRAAAAGPPRRASGWAVAAGGGHALLLERRRLISPTAASGRWPRGRACCRRPGTPGTRAAATTYSGAIQGRPRRTAPVVQQPLLQRRVGGRPLAGRRGGGRRRSPVQRRVAAPALRQRPSPMPASRPSAASTNGAGIDGRRHRRQQHEVGVVDLRVAARACSRATATAAPGCRSARRLARTIADARRFSGAPQK